MADELDPSKVAAYAVGSGGILAALWSAFLRRANRNEEKLDASTSQSITHLMRSQENHRDQLEALKQKVVELDTRLAMREGRYGVEPLTVNQRPSAAIEALRAEHKSKNK